MFLSEPLKPDGPGFDTAAMSAGAPGIPSAFRWKKERLVVQKVLRHWKDTAPCRNGSGERYVNKHWFECTFESGATGTLYFERRVRRGASPTQRWFLYKLEPCSRDR